ncbi:FixH family protein [Streptomyces sp. XD-27]|uniref:copper resistance CopC/CopD family protein n=1 Tax=Streptomyces sp. XD-27 TaxID=3062779 RepID=UPI0026F4436F|nr:FixH family protein [Streptomyces sp. XD-27]WKX71634.1 copper resistance protein CopC [Streptomyces sp. XD-27]
MTSVTAATSVAARRRLRLRLRLLSICGTLLAALLWTVGYGAAPAAAHAALTGTDPAQGSVLPDAPERVTLTFSEGVLLSKDSVRVLDPHAKRVDTGRPGHVDGASSTASVALRSGLPDGTYTVAWQAVSEDSHPVGGAFTFSIGAPSKTSVSVPTTAEPDAAVDLLYGIARYAAYAGFAALVGGCLFAGVCRSARPVARVAAGGWVTLFTATLLQLLLRGPYVNGDGVGAALDLGALDDVLSTKPGAALLSRLLLLGAAAVFLAVLFGTYARQNAAEQESEKESMAARRARRDLAFGLGIGGAVVAAGLGATWAMAEHASVGIQPWLAMPVDVAHLLAVAVWLGGLLALLTTLRAGEPVPAAAVRRFSRMAFGAVLVLVATGLYQSWRQVGSWDALTRTEYGKWLLVKVGLVAALVAVAAVSRRWTGRLTDPARNGDEAAETAATTDAAEPAEATATTSAAEPAETLGTTSAAGPAETTAPTGAAGPAGADADPDPVRAAQLARQRAAVDRTATRRRRDADPERSALRRSVLAETAIAVVLLAVTTVLTSTQPGRAETEQAAAGTSAPAAGPVSVKIPYDTGSKSGRGSAEITLDPARKGDNEVHVYLTDAAGRPVDVAEIKLSLTQRKQAIGPLAVPLTQLSTGHLGADRFQLPVPGAWQLSLTVRTSDIDQVTEVKTVKIG